MTSARIASDQSPTPQMIARAVMERTGLSGDPTLRAVVAQIVTEDRRRGGFTHEAAQALVELMASAWKNYQKADLYEGAGRSPEGFFNEGIWCNVDFWPRPQKETELKQEPRLRIPGRLVAPEPNGARGRATEWLAGLLRQGGRGMKEVKWLAASKGIAYATLRRAKDALRVRSHKSAMSGPWMWSLPEDAHDLSEGAQENRVPPSQD